MSSGFQPSRCRFIASAPGWEDAPQTGLPEVAVAGRSNVGKSSLINFLLGRRQLARSSSTPGRTQLLNYFDVDGRLLLVDLPGYGYAQAPKGEVQRWIAAVRAYVARGRRLRGVVLLLDVRREPSRDDLSFAKLVLASGLPLLPIVTKADKVGRGQRAQQLRPIRSMLRKAGSTAEPVVTSARLGEGRQEAWKGILGMLEEPRRAAAAKVVAIDGPSGAGKSTTARALAARLGWNYIDTGAMYRCIGLKADRLGVHLEDDEALARLVRSTVLELTRDAAGRQRILLDGEDVSEAIREHRVSSLASRVSARRPVREAMSGFQRTLGLSAPSVLEGRDIGTVVFPDAFLKIYLTASDEERARRRADELRGRGEAVAFEEVLRDMRRRDLDDSSREHAPLRAASDAVEVDTTGLAPEAVIERLATLVRQRLTPPNAPFPEE